MVCQRHRFFFREDQRLQKLPLEPQLATPHSQGATKGSRQKEFDQFLFVFGTLSVTFLGHLF